MSFLAKLFGLGPKVDYKELINNGAIIVDVRSPQEFKSGNASKSINIPLQNLKTQLNKVKGKEVILVCKSGVRASQAKAILTKNGINAYNAGAWQNLN